MGNTTCQLAQAVAPISHPYERGGVCRWLFFTLQDVGVDREPPKPSRGMEELSGSFESPGYLE